ncbi:Imm58 family immunity protein [Agarivorans sp. JK6]|uniref:Imm58 family immunity protein n=1 Tax=Agarivorans sp. JK6 TaxID=2997426 RepID=UPI003873A904
MNKWKLAFLVVVPLLVISNICFIYMTVDTAISYTYLQDSFKHHEQSESTLGKLVVAGSKDYSKKDILHLLRQAKPDAFVVDDVNSISFEGNTFIFENDRLVEIN